MNTQDYFLEVDWEKLRDDIKKHNGTDRKSLGQLSQVSGVNIQTLINFIDGTHKSLRTLATLCIIAAMGKKRTSYVSVNQNLIDAAKPQPNPEKYPNKPHVNINQLVMKDLETRAEAGERKYGIPLETFNGRDPMIDAYQESLDQTLYLRQAIEEKHLQKAMSKPDAMTFQQYNDFAMSDKIYVSREDDPNYIFFGIVEEAGEVAGKWKKILRNKKGKWDQSDADAIAIELGDTIWYICAIADKFGFTLEDVARRNITKLKDRAERGVICSTGDNR